MSVFVSTPKSRQEQVLIGSVARTDTTAKDLFMVPKGAVITSIEVFVAVASDAGTSADVTVTDGTNTLLNAVDVKTAAGIVASAAKLENVFGTPTNYDGLGLTSDLKVDAVYAETGTASTAGGPFFVIVKFVMMGPGESVT